MTARIAAMAFAAQLAACSGASPPKPLPSGPPPEYEEPRDYKPKGNVDAPAASESPFPNPPPHVGEGAAGPPASSVPSASAPPASSAAPAAAPPPKP